MNSKEKQLTTATGININQMNIYCINLLQRLSHLV